MNQPFYSLIINSFNTKFAINVNDCDLIEHRDNPTPLQVEYPINQYLKPGINSIEVYLYSIKKEGEPKKGLLANGTLTAGLLVKENDEGQQFNLANLIYDANGCELNDIGYVDFRGNIANQAKLIANSTQPCNLAIVDGKVTPVDEEYDYRILESHAEIGITNGLKISLTFELPMPFPEPSFFSADDIQIEMTMDDNEYDTFVNELNKEFKVIWDLIANKDFEGLAPYLEKRSSEYDACFYKKPGTSLKEIIDDVRNAMNDPDQTLDDIQNPNASTFFNGKVAYMASEAPKSFLRFKLASGLASYYPIYWAKFDGKWEIVR